MKRFSDILRALLIPLAGFLLTGCITCFFATPNSVGQKSPHLDASTLKITGKGERTLELYRIGDDYYIKEPFIFKPWHNDYLLSSWRLFVGIAHSVDEDERTWERAVYYCKVNEYTQSTKEWKAEKIPVLTRTPGRSAGAEALSEAQAAKLNPVFVKKLPVDRFYNDSEHIPSRYTWTHYAMLPVTGAVLVCIDAPCAIFTTICAIPFVIVEVIIN